VAADRAAFEAQAAAFAAAAAPAAPPTEAAAPGGGGGGGDGWDFAFPVELDAGGNLKIQWNRGDEPGAVRAALPALGSFSGIVVSECDAILTCLPTGCAARAEHIILGHIMSGLIIVWRLYGEPYYVRVLRLR
jgi:hypothetical protein